MRFRIIDTEQVLEHLSEQFRVKCYFLFNGCVFLNGKLIVREEREESCFFVKEQFRGNVQFPSGVYVIGEAIDAIPTGARSLKRIQAVKQPTVDERHLLEVLQKRLGIVEQVFVTILAGIAMPLVIARAKSALAYRRVERSEEEVLQHRLIIVRCFR